MDSDRQADFLIRLRAEPDHDVPAVVRLRRLLKWAWRIFRLRAVSVEEIAGGARAAGPAAEERAT